MPEDLWASAATIVADGAELGAGRVCFPVEGAFVSVGVDETEVEAALVRHRPLRYKYQLRRDERWQNVGGYRAAFRGDLVRRALASADLPTLRTFERPDLATARASEPARVAAALGSLERHVIDGLAGPRGHSRLGGVRRVLADAGEALGPEGRHLHAGLTLLEAALGAGLEDALDARDVGGVRTAVVARARAEGWSDEPSAAAVELMLGRLASVTDRDEAAAHLRRAEDLGATALAGSFAFDRGAATYVTATEVERGTDDLAAEVRGGLVHVDAREPGSELALLVSADETFLRIYAPQLVHLAQQLPHVDVVVLLCGADDPSALAAEVGTYATALAALNRSGRPENIHVVATPVPAAVAEVRTFYACARFLAVRRLLERYPRLYLMDADLTVTADPTAYLERLADLPLAFHHSRGLPALWPWRRYAAGNVAVNRDVLATGALTHLERYLGHGLARSGSWTLDQNALAYVAERCPDVAQRLNHGRRPFSQIAFRSTWERTYARRGRAS
ncbi:hypothetical protein [Litorihabitans aurantiacus]|uniref:Uncharacterized protein n=1 Tax=Litorihabitans aurantiacus TaxID=1930061 RepID=A0AA38CW65_9MICO|nr:hypothetical protein [Litorihabitans aurantiacus]GMA32712.1 hypothetical protein GCM10025875_27040 [Litorihabitans aurantiacus]